MYYIGMDLHKQDLVMAVEDERGPVGRVRRIACRDTGAIRAAVGRWLGRPCARRELFGGAAAAE